MARPTKLTEELITAICDRIRLGAYRETAAVACQVPISTFWDWLRKGKERPGTIYGRFVESVQEAEKATEIMAVEKVFLAGLQDVDHFKWWLERKFPQRWGRNRLDLHEIKKRLEALERNLPSEDSQEETGTAGESSTNGRITDSQQVPD